MIRLLDKSKISWFSFFFVFCIVIYAGKATVFTRSLGDIRASGTIFALFITCIFLLSNQVRFTKQYLLSVSVFLLYALATSINNHMINPLWISEWLIWLTIAYCMCQGLGNKMFVVVETVLYFLCIIDIILWSIQLIAPSFIIWLVNFFQFSKPFAEGDTVSANMLVYTLLNYDIGDNTFVIFSRNAGFAWEPGAFACFICLGVFCNMIRTNFRLRSNKGLWILLIALISTESTTGFMILILMLVVWMILNKKYKFLPIVIPVIIAMFTLPFVRDKILGEIEYTRYADYSDYSGGSMSRFLSFQLDFEEFLRHPVLGLGGYIEGTWLKQQGYEFATISGIGHLLAYWGAIMASLFVALLIGACNKIKHIIGSNSAYVLIVTIIGMMISYSLWETPLFIAFWMFGVYSVENKKLMQKNGLQVR